MEFESQICTSEEQSERLLALGLKAETADMSYFHTVGFEGNDLWLPSLSPYENVVKAPNYGEKTKIYLKSHTIPAWSLHRLIEIAGIRAFSPVSTINGWYDDIIAQIQSSIHIGYIDEKYLNMDIVNAREEKNMELLKNN
jgi:hypothetical protein